MSTARDRMKERLWEAFKEACRGLGEAKMSRGPARMKFEGTLDSDKLADRVLADAFKEFQRLPLSEQNPEARAQIDRLYAHGVKVQAAHMAEVDALKARLVHFEAENAILRQAHSGKGGAK